MNACQNPADPGRGSSLPSCREGSWHAVMIRVLPVHILTSLRLPQLEHLESYLKQLDCSNIEPNLKFALSSSLISETESLKSVAILLLLEREVLPGAQLELHIFHLHSLSLMYCSEALMNLKHCTSFISARSTNLKCDL